MPGRRLSAEALQAARLRARRAQRAEGLSRRRRALARAVRADRRAELLRQGRLPAYLGGAGRARRAERAITLHNFYVPAGGDEPDPEINPKFAHKLGVPRRDARACRPASAAIRSARFSSATSTSRRSSTTSGATSRCSRWFRTRRSNARNSLPRRRRAAGSTAMRVHTPEPEKLYTWWSYRAMDNWRAADRGRRLDHVWTSDALAGPGVEDRDRQGLSRRRSGRPTTCR